MKRAELLLCIVPLMCCSVALAASDDSEPVASFFARRAEGWHWYHDPPVQKKPADTLPAAAPTESERRQQALAQFERIKQEIDEAQKIAYVTRAPEDGERYMRLQTEHVRRSSEFADVLQRVVWANPEMTFPEDRPVGTLAYEVYKGQKAKERAELLAQLAQTHALWFFFRSDCPYCHAFGPILKGFTQAAGLRVLPISLDGRGLPDFQEFRADNGVASRLNVTTVPALYLVDPAARTVVPLGVGVMSETQLAERLAAVAGGGQTPNVQAATRLAVRRLPIEADGARLAPMFTNPGDQ